MHEKLANENRPGLMPVLVVGLLLSASRSEAQPHVALPPVNLGGSSFMDAPGGPGLVGQEEVGGSEATRFTNGSGAGLPGRFSLRFSKRSVSHLSPKQRNEVRHG
jgi:hypothetical protein